MRFRTEAFQGIMEFIGRESRETTKNVYRSLLTGLSMEFGYEYKGSIVKNDASWFFRKIGARTTEDKFSVALITEPVMLSYWQNSESPGSMARLADSLYKERKLPDKSFTVNDEIRAVICDISDRLRCDIFSALITSNIRMARNFLDGRVGIDELEQRSIDTWMFIDALDDMEEYSEEERRLGKSAVAITAYALTPQDAKLRKSALSHAIASASIYLTTTESRPTAYAFLSNCLRDLLKIGGVSLLLE